MMPYTIQRVGGSYVVSDSTNNVVATLSTRQAARDDAARRVVADLGGWYEDGSGFVRLTSGAAGAPVTREQITAATISAQIAYDG